MARNTHIGLSGRCRVAVAVVVVLLGESGLSSLLWWLPCRWMRHGTRPCAAVLLLASLLLMKDRGLVVVLGLSTGALAAGSVARRRGKSGCGGGRICQGTVAVPCC